jgi:hypothetical protein
MVTIPKPMGTVLRIGVCLIPMIGVTVTEDDGCDDGTPHAQALPGIKK